MMLRLWSLAILVVCAVAGPASAQTPHMPSGQSLLPEGNQDLPIQIEAATLEVHDKTKTAAFSGDVQVTQGEMTMKCQSLVIFYGAEHGAGGNQTVASATTNSTSTAHPQQSSVLPQGAQDIRRIEARGGVTVTTKDQNATGDLGVYDVKKKTITLTGNVTIAQGKNVLHGDRVVVDTVSGNAHIESGATAQNRVRALILPSKNSNGGASNFLPAAPAKAN
jgi:lipopolysaccharide export system protein LptA